MQLVTVEMMKMFVVLLGFIIATLLSGKRDLEADY